MLAVFGPGRKESLGIAAIGLMWAKLVFVATPNSCRVPPPPVRIRGCFNEGYFS